MMTVYKFYLKVNTISYINLQSRIKFMAIVLYYIEI